ncbi:hypothetical protein Bcep1808_3962 [Burkholderia vietnamiensis G4]|uniref:Uncharacterized protein n=1 Tax=Burkholderia vietnamiensis (strain G4 / LMG 22486) TaxID=269482 RepID=A4JKZ0_BURVG|nr:hypothetical protein Bcep1808_3962 [Burkholderia vietnamiensis G4]
MSIHMLVREIDSKRCLPCARDDEVDISFDDKSARKNRYCAMARIRSLSRLIRSKGSECGHWPALRAIAPTFIGRLPIIQPSERYI